MKKFKLFMLIGLSCAALGSIVLSAGCGPKVDGVTTIDATKNTLPPPKMPDNANLPPEAKAGIQQRMQQQGASQQQGRTK